MYSELEPILLGPMFTLSYLAQFLTLSSLVTSVVLWNGKTIWYVLSQRYLSTGSKPRQHWRSKKTNLEISIISS